MFLWFGNSSNARTQAKAKYFANKMKEEVADETLVTIVDFKDPSSEFWKHVTGDKNMIATSDKDDVEATARLSSKMWRFSEASGRLDIRVIIIIYFPKVC